MSYKPINASPNRLLAGERHFTLDELGAALADSFRDVDRQRALLHFGQLQCQVCWDLLKKLAELEPPPHATGAADVTFDPVLAALRRWVVARVHPSAPDQLRPVHRALLDDSRPEELGFFRLILEEARQHALEHQASGLAVAWNTLELFKSLPLEYLGPRWIDLKALALAYVGDEHRAAGERKPATRLLAKAEQELLAGTGDPEMRVTWLELKANLDQADRKFISAFSRLDEALELLQSLELAERRAETLFSLGLGRLRSGDNRGARETFRLALSDMAPGKTLRLRLRTLQFLALAEVQSRRFTDAREHLAAARTLEDGHATQLLQAQRLWIEGNLQLETQNYSQAETPLRKSLQRFLLFKRDIDAAQVLVSLARLYAVTQRPGEFDGLEREFESLIRAPATENLVLKLREQVVRWAKNVGLSLPSSDELRTQLERDRKKWIH